MCKHGFPTAHACYVLFGVETDRMMMSTSGSLAKSFAYVNLEYKGRKLIGSVA